MSFILGIKKEMAQIFKDDLVIPVTVVKAGPCFVVDVKSKEINGYEAVRLALGKRSKINKPLKGQLKDLELNPKWIKEFRTVSSLQRGETVKVDSFKEGDKVDVQGNSIGKGFQGVVKRHGFKGKNTTHGTKHDIRRSGSIGATAPQRVFKGKRMAGRMGGESATSQNLEIIKIDPAQDLLYIKGAVPGKRNALLKIITRP